MSPSFGSSSHTQVWTLALLRLQCTLQMPYFCEQHALRDYSNIAQSNLTGTASECCCQQGTAALNLSTQSKTHSAVIMISLPYKSKSKFGRHQTLAKTSELASLLHCCAYARCRTEKRGLLTEPSFHCQRSGSKLLRQLPQTMHYSTVQWLQYGVPSAHLVAECVAYAGAHTPPQYSPDGLRPQDQHFRNDIHSLRVAAYLAPQLC